MAYRLEFAKEILKIFQRKYRSIIFLTLECESNKPKCREKYIGKFDRVKTRSFIFLRFTSKGNYYVDTGTLASSVTEKKNFLQKIFG